MNLTPGALDDAACTLAILVADSGDVQMLLVQHVVNPGILSRGRDARVARGSGDGGAAGIANGSKFDVRQIGERVEDLSSMTVETNQSDPDLLRKPDSFGGRGRLQGQASCQYCPSCDRHVSDSTGIHVKL